MRVLSFLNLLKTEDGVSLTELMVGGGILAGVALAGATLFRDQKVAQKKVELDQELVAFHMNLQREMNNADNCNATLGTFGNFGIASGPPGPPGPPNTAPYSLPALNKCTSNCPVAGAGTSVPLITRNTFTDPRQIWEVEDIVIPNSMTDSGRLNIKVRYRLNPKITGGASRSITKDIMVHVRFGAPNAFTKCVDAQEASIDNLEQDLCKALNYSEQVSSTGSMVRWNDETQSCVRTNDSVDCASMGLIVDGVDSTGMVRCRAMTTPYDAQVMEDATNTACSGAQRPTLIFDSVNRKFRVQCQ